MIANYVKTFLLKISGWYHRVRRANVGCAGISPYW